MIDLPPKPLPQHRLTRLLHGLRQRMTGSLQETANEVARLEESIVERQSALAVVGNDRQQQLSTDQATTTTKWDEAIHSCWDEAELRTYKAIYETAEREKKIKLESQARIDQATKEAQAKIHGFEKKFLKAKEKPLARLRKFRTANNQLGETIDALESSAQSSLTQNSLAIPNTDALDSATIEALLQPAETSTTAYEMLSAKIVESQKQCQRIVNSPLAKLFDSALFWILCAVVLAGTTAAFALSGAMEVVMSIAVGAGTTIGLVIFTFLAVRPWLKKTAAREYPKLQKLIDEARELHKHGESRAMSENDAELAKLAAKRDESAKEAQNWRDNEVRGISKKYEEAKQQLREHSMAEKSEAKNGLVSALDQTEDKYRNRLLALDANFRRDAKASEVEFEDFSESVRNRIEEIDRGGANRMRVATQKAVSLIARSRRFRAEHFPEWEAFASQGDGSGKGENSFWPASLAEPTLPLGDLHVPGVLPDASALSLSAEQLEAPVYFSPLKDEYLVVHGDPANPNVQGLLRNLIMRAITTLPAGKVQTCVIDPPGLGRDFGWLMHLSDFDPDLVTHRVWTQQSHIVKQTAALALAAEDCIQQSLRSDYANIVQYNRDAGALAEPFRILVWNSMPNGLDDQSWKNLQSLLDSGSRCGIIPILVVDPKEPWPYGEQQDLVRRRGLHIELDDAQQRFVVRSERYGELLLDAEPTVGDELAQQIVREVGRRSLLSNRVEVPLERMVPNAEERWQADSSHSLEIPIGQSGVGRTHSLKLGIGTAQHAVIAGKTGSGKSSLLHALITSAALKYSPEALRLVLLDFKKGVEFQVYSDAELPHADIIGIESHREFGLSALEYIDGCMQRRGESFRKAGVQDIASWNALHPDEPIPRMLVVIDEFQEIFIEDDKLSGQASLILDRIVRQGRSFGVHAVLSSQTLAGSYSLPRTTLGQMAVRIALQCDASDAQVIFAEDNPAAARLKHPGQAVYNDAGGRIEGNQPMQIGWLPKKQQVEWFSEQPRGYRNDDVSTNLLGRTIVYDGNRAATWTDTNANMAIQNAKAEVNPDATWMVAGESVAINPAVVYPLTLQAGRNVLIVGGEDPQAASVLHTATASFTRAHAGASPLVYAVQGAKPTDAKVLALPSVWEKLDCELKVADQRGAEKTISEIHELLQTRVDDGEESPDEESNVQTGPVLLNLMQIGRMRELRREDDFASFGETELTADKKLEEILRDGPSVGIYTVIWAESYSTVNRWLSRSALREIEIRMLMQMSANDSTNLVDSIAASRLGDNVMLLFDEATGNEERFRPFAMDSLKDLSDWTKQD